MIKNKNKISRLLLVDLDASFFVDIYVDIGLRCPF
jgi:hypothetical protein